MSMSIFHIASEIDVRTKGRGNGKRACGNSGEIGCSP